MSAPASSDGLDALVSRLDYPMFVVTAAAGDELGGCLVGFATQCSIHPARFLACISKQNHTFRVATRSPVLAVHVLARSDRALGELFGAETGDRSDKFSRCRWQPGPGGVPVLEDALGGFAGPVVARKDLGDHEGFVIDIAEAWTAGEGQGDRTGGVLTFQDVRGLSPGHEA